MEETLKVVGAIASLFAVYKIVIDVILARSTRRRDEYSFTKEYLSDLEENTEHRFTLEKGFYALTGKIYSIPEVKVLLSQPSPSIMLSLRGDSGSFIVFDSESKKYLWNGKYKIQFVRQYAGKWFFICYMVAASLAMMPVYTKGISTLRSFPIAVFSFSLLIVAVSCLAQMSNLSNAKKLMSGIVYEHSADQGQKENSSDG